MQLGCYKRRKLLEWGREKKDASPVSVSDPFSPSPTPFLPKSGNNTSYSPVNTAKKAPLKKYERGKRRGWRKPLLLSSSLESERRRGARLVCDQKGGRGHPPTFACISIQPLPERQGKMRRQAGKVR